MWAPRRHVVQHHLCDHWYVAVLGITLRPPGCNFVYCVCVPACLFNVKKRIVADLRSNVPVGK